MVADWSAMDGGEGEKESGLSREVGKRWRQSDNPGKLRSKQAVFLKFMMLFSGSEKLAGKLCSLARFLHAH